MAELGSPAPGYQPSLYISHPGRLRRSLTRLSKLVDDSLIDARLPGGPKLDLQGVSVANLVEGVCSDVAFHSEERDVVVERKIEAFGWEVDPKLMASGITKLLSTATNLPAVPVAFESKCKCATSGCNSKWR